MKPAERHARWMKLALRLARQGEGLTRPNPPVGAVLVKNNRLIAAGFHKRAGADHAEIIAIKKAGKKAANAGLYVTLEPCSTFGKTPPCVAAIIQSGIREVVIATRDPNPRHQGKSLAALRKAGIKVREGIGRAEAQALIAPFHKWILTGQPYLSLKLATALDGKIADLRGQARWISGKKARLFVHDLRRRVDAILVGAGTILADNPALLPRPALGRQPWRIIVDATGRIPVQAGILNAPAGSRTIIATTARCPWPRRQAWEQRGAQVWVLPSRPGGVSLPALMNKTGQLGLLHVLCEGGSELAGALVREKMVDEFLFFIAPCLLGGHNALSAIGGTGWPLATAPRLRFTECRFIGKDILVRAKPLRRSQKSGDSSQ